MKKPPEYVKDDKCPYCGYAIECATAIGHTNRPRKGDVSLCIKCAKVAVYDKDLNLVKPTSIQVVIAEADPLVKRAQFQIRRLGSKRN